MPAKCSAVRYQKHRSLSLRAVLLFCPLCSLCFKGMSKGRTRVRRVNEYGHTIEEKCCPQWLCFALQGLYKSRTKQSTPNTKEERSEQKKYSFKRRKGKKGEAKGKGKRVKAGFEVREKAVLRELKQVFKRGWKHSRQDKKAFYTTLKRNRNGARGKSQRRARVPQSGGER